MRADAFQVAVLAVAVGLSSAALTAAAVNRPSELERGDGLGPAPYKLVDECGERFVELAAQPEPQSFQWKTFGEPVASYMDVVAYSNGQDGDPRRDNTHGLYQCTELAHRYLHDVFGVPTRIGLGLGNGVDLARKVAVRFAGQSFRGGITGDTPVELQYFANGSSACRPMVGTVVSIAMPWNGVQTPGHVAIIRDLQADGLKLEATLFEQHGGASLAPGEEVPASHITFERVDGAWEGTFHSPGGGGDWPVEGWTSAVTP